MSSFRKGDITASPKPFPSSMYQHKKGCLLSGFIFSQIQGGWGGGNCVLFFRVVIDKK